MPATAAIKFNTPTYSVMVGHRRGENAIRGYLERTGTGVTSPVLKGIAMPHLTAPADEYIPNRTMAWGRRLIDGKPDENDMSFSISSPAYKGEVELLPYGAINGIPIELRYMESAPSLDYLFQLKIGLPAYNTEKSVEYDYLSLKSGQLDIDTAKKPLYALFIKAHHLNANSPCKIPRSESDQGIGEAMRDLVEFDSISAKATVADENFEAYSLVKGASSFVKLEMLHKITAKGEVTYNEGDQNDLFNAMKVFANENGTLLLKNWNNYKSTISSLIEKYKAFDALDYGKEGVIAIGIEPDRKVLQHSFPKAIKKDGITDYMFHHLLDEEVQSIIGTMEIYQNTLK